jgi:hypothetical protein
MGTAPSIIGVSGFMRTGKDSVASLLAGFGYTKLSFADPLRKMAKDIDPYISIKDAHEDVLDLFHPLEAVLYSRLLNAIGYERSKEIPDFRRFLQRLGTEGIRNNFGVNAWVNLAMKTIKGAPEGTKFVLPDVRFPNEADAIHALGGAVWRTERPGYEGGTHPSEAMILEFEPDVILNTDSLLDHDGTKGLGTLVLEQLGETLPQETLLEWADAILNA